MHIIRWLTQIIGALTLLLVLSGCSAVKLGYSNAPSLAYWWLNDYVDFTDAQAPKVRDALDRLHQWHRATELPRYAALLGQMEALATTDITPAQVCTLAADIRSRYNTLTSQASPDIAALAATLSADQIQHLQRRYELADADYRKKWLDASPSERAGRRVTQWVERSEMIYGPLDDAQRDWLRQEVASTPGASSTFFEDRQRRQQETLQALRVATAANASAANAQQQLARYFEQSQNPADPKVLRQRQQQLADGCRTFAGLHNRTTPAQRDIAVKRLRAYQRDLREMVGAQ